LRGSEYILSREILGGQLVEPEADRRERFWIFIPSQWRGPKRNHMDKEIKAMLKIVAAAKILHSKIYRLSIFAQKVPVTASKRCAC
jgi:hypothetical protein